MNFKLLFFCVAMCSLAQTSVFANNVSTNKQELLIKLAPEVILDADILAQLSNSKSKAERIFGQWVKIEVQEQYDFQTLISDPRIEFVQPNYQLKLLNDYKVKDPLRRKALLRMLAKNRDLRVMKTKVDNLPIPAAPTSSQRGIDPLFVKQWGMLDNHVDEAWKLHRGSPEMIVAVIDTGVDYTHEDLLPNLWRNEKEIPDNNIDDDHNGFVDDIIGWDFARNDNKPFDLSVEPLDLLFGGGNPGHGTHCAGNIAARGQNGIGIAGVAPEVKIMSLRFLTEKGEGDTAGAVGAIRYAVDNGAKVLSNSWGGEGDPNEPVEENRILKEAIEYAQSKGVLFIAAAGNGRNGVGFSNDTDAHPALPASYDYENIISVAAIDNKNELGTFSNFGVRTVDIGAPGVAVYSTTVENNYSDVVIDKFGFYVTWDGTSMATPHVAGAAALYWSLHPQLSWPEVKRAILESTTEVPALKDKVLTGGKLDVLKLMQY